MIFVALIFKIPFISGFSKTPFLTHLYNFGSYMHCFFLKFANFQQVNKYFIIKNLLNQRLVFN